MVAVAPGLIHRPGPRVLLHLCSFCSGNVDGDSRPDVRYRGGFTDEQGEASLRGGRGSGTGGSVDAMTGELIAILAVGATLLGVMVALFGWMRGDMGRIGDKLDRVGERLSAVEGRLSVVETILHERTGTIAPPPGESS